MERNSRTNSRRRQSAPADIKVYRAKSMKDALELVRDELGPEAAVLHTREVRSGLMRFLGGGRQIEIVATTSMQVPSRLPPKTPTTKSKPQPAQTQPVLPPPPQDDEPLPQLPELKRPQIETPPVSQLSSADFRAKLRDELRLDFSRQSVMDKAIAEKSLVENLCEAGQRPVSQELPPAMFQLFTDLLDADISSECARQLLDDVRKNAPQPELDDPQRLKTRLARRVEDDLRIGGPIQSPEGERRLVALVGPTGVGKTTTIAKLAANFRLREQRRVGLITVDTYRIAAVEQLRTYADIMDLPMEVVSTPRELRDALQRLSHLDLVLMDTAGRSPRDELQIQELRSMLGEAKPHEVHLVLSSMSSVHQLQKAAERFERVGATAMMLTKLDEASGLGHLLPLLRNCRLPLSYVTNGQNVPDDIEAADPRKLARSILGSRS